MDEKDPWSGILAAASFAVQATYHTTAQATPMQLVFGRDDILNVKHIHDCEEIRIKKQNIIRKTIRKKLKK